ncbi:MAG: phosphate-starvation-inducible PsiE family protein [Ktedonobacterales bacterium]
MRQPRQVPPASRSVRYGFGRSIRWLEAAESVIYLLVGGCFLGVALLSLVYGVISFGVAVAALLHSGLLERGNIGVGANAIISFVSDLLLTLIILEVMSTVVRYLQIRATSLKPFLIIGIISATRSILAVGARLSLAPVQQLSVTEFRVEMIELVVSAAVIVALGVTLRLIGSLADEQLENGETPADAQH